MAGELLVDSSFWIGRLRAGADPLFELAEISEEWDLAICGMVIVEVLRGFKTEKERRRFQDAFSCMICLPTPQYIWERTAQLGWSMDRAGKIIPATDLVIATCALAAGATVLAFDRHFSWVPSLRVISKLPSIT